MAQKILHVTELTMDFGGIRALNNLDLDVQEGEIVALIGPNGRFGVLDIDSVAAISGATGQGLQAMLRRLRAEIDRGHAAERNALEESVPWMP